MELGLTFDKLLLIGLVAVIIIGPERLPKAAETFAKFVRRAGEYLRETKSKMRDELGPEIDEVDWRKLDPRQYDPRRIIREALLDDAPVPTVRAAQAGAAVASTATPPPPPVRSPFRAAGEVPPHDLEAT